MAAGGGGGRWQWWLLGAATVMLQRKIRHCEKKELTGLILNKRLKKIDCGD